jgi:hypothetical protein
MTRIIPIGLVAALLTGPAMAKNPDGLARIYEYTLFDQTTPDGKYPVWVYYDMDVKGRKFTDRVEMPSLAMCTVTAQSSRSLAVIRSGNTDEIKPRTEAWAMARDIWSTAYERSVIVDAKPLLCD